MLTAITGVILIFLAIILSRPITTFVHELGHAIPSLLFTDDPVVIYIGSYGDTSNSTATTIGRLNMIFKFKVTDLQLGLCRHQPVAKIWQELIIILGGPIFSLLLGVLFVGLLPFFKENQFIAFTIGIFLTSGIFDFLVNIIPSKSPLQMYDGRLIQNDGAQFLAVLKSRNYPEVYFEGIQLLEEDKKTAAIEKLKQAIEQGVHDLPTYQLIMAVFMEDKRTEAAIDFHAAYSSFFKLAAVDYTLMGSLYEREGFHNKAIAHYNKAIEMDYMNVKALKLRGKLLMEIGHYQEGKADLHKVEMMEGRAGVRKT